MPAIWSTKKRRSDVPASAFPDRFEARVPTPCHRNRLCLQKATAPSLLYSQEVSGNEGSGEIAMRLPSSPQRWVPGQAKSMVAKPTPSWPWGASESLCEGSAFGSW